MLRFMAARQIPAGALCVTRHGKVLLDRAYGWRDPGHHLPVTPDSPFRIASLCKPITAAAIRLLAARGDLQLSAHVFDLGQPGGGILHLQPFGLPDPLLQEITLAHLLAHTGGWDRDRSGDPMFQQADIARTLGVESPPSAREIARYMMGRPLDHDPGRTSAYSNFGYLLLGLVIEEVTHQDYVGFVRGAIFAPLGVPPDEVALGASLPARRDPREPSYSDPGQGPDLFLPGREVPWPDGGFHLESMAAHGGLTCTAAAYARFLTTYWIDGTPRRGDGQDWTFFGSLPGTWTLGRQRRDGVNIAAFFNQRADPSGLPYDEILRLLDDAANRIPRWPEAETGRTRPPRPGVALQQVPPALLVNPLAGRIYRLEQSRDTLAWVPAGPAVVGNGETLRFDLTPGIEYARVVVE